MHIKLTRGKEGKWSDRSVKHNKIISRLIQCVLHMFLPCKHGTATTVVVYRTQGKLSIRLPASKKLFFFLADSMVVVVLRQRQVLENRLVDCLMSQLPIEVIVRLHLLTTLLSCVTGGISGFS